MENDNSLSTALFHDNLVDELSQVDEDNHNDKYQTSNASAIQSNAISTAQHVKLTCKIIVLGDSGVGKTCLTFRFCAGRFPLLSEATIGLDFREKVIELEGQRLKLQLWDTAGQERFRRSITHHYYRNVDAVVFVYDVNMMSSFKGLNQWVDEVDNHDIPASVPRILVGNKCDTGQQQVDTTIAQRWADDRHMPLFETSAKDDSKSDHVEGIFLTLAHKVRHRKPLIRPVADPSDPGTQTVRLVYQSNLTGGEEEGWTSCCL